MLRLATPDYLRFCQSDKLNATFGGGEANVAVSLANYGIATEFVTRLPKNDIARACVMDLRKYGVGTSHIVYGGDRLGIYFLETGAVARASKVVYDRAHSAISEIQPGMVNWEEVFKDASWFHWTGITPAISQGAADACLECAARRGQLGTAQQHATTLGQQGVALHQAVGLGHGAVGHHHLGRPGFEQRSEYPCRRTAGANQQDALARKRQARAMLQVAHKPHAVGVVGQPAVGIEAQGVGGPGQLRAWRDLRSQRDHLELEGQGDVAPPSRPEAGGRVGARDEVANRCLEPVERGLNAPVGQGLAGLSRKGLVNEGRLAVRHGMADHGIAVELWSGGRGNGVHFGTRSFNSAPC